MDCWKNIEIEIGTAIEIGNDRCSNMFDPDFDHE